MSRADGLIDFPSPLQDVFTASALEPDVAAIADSMFLTEEGREIFTAAQPELLDADGIAEVCGPHAGGCFLSTGNARHLDRIYILWPDDPRYRHAVITTAAHELLHAAYERLEPPVRERVDEILAEEVVRIPPGDELHGRIETSVGDKEGNRPTELFAYLGSEIMPEGGFPPELEAVYARYFTDRAALVGLRGG
ncbi:hypothetical protein [Microbacterium album]|nr:hypothetical protein [Microbacterium album]